MRNTVLCALVAISSCGSASANADAGMCVMPQRRVQQIELMFGRNIAGRLGVSEVAWSRFLAREITRRFPGGFTVLDAAGQWRDDRHGRPEREPGKLVIIVTADEASARDKIDAIVAAYKHRFRQRSVGVILHDVCAAF